MKGKGKLLTFWIIGEDPQGGYNERESVFTEDEANNPHREIEATSDAESHTEKDDQETFCREYETKEDEDDTKSIPKLSLDLCKEPKKLGDIEGNDQTENPFYRNDSHKIVASDIESEE